MAERVYKKRYLGPDPNPKRPYLVDIARTEDQELGLETCPALDRARELARRHTHDWFYCDGRGCPVSVKIDPLGGYECFQEVCPKG